MKRLIAIFIIILVILILLGLRFGHRIKNTDNDSNNDTVSDTVSKIQIQTESETLTLNIEIARTPEERETGLSNRQSLPETHGMLFIFQDEQIHTFWMKDTYIPLDIIFINSNKRIVHISENTLLNQTQEIYSSLEPSQYVLEVNAGWCNENNVKLGDSVEF